MHDLKGHTALVTGASSGIGLAISQCLLQSGCRVNGIARDFAKADLQHPLFESHVLDLQDLEKTDALLKRICQQRIDYFVHCAGSGLFGSIEQFSSRQIDRYLKSNLTSALLISHYIVPLMRRHKCGRIIFIGSESALKAGKKGVLYSTAKFGLRGLALSLREDCGKDGINVTLINPGMVRTAFFDEQAFAPGQHSSNAITTGDIASTVLHVLSSNPDIVFDEINLTPRNKSIDFS